MNLWHKICNHMCNLCNHMWYMWERYSVPRTAISVNLHASCLLVCMPQIPPLVRQHIAGLPTLLFGSKAVGGGRAVWQYCTGYALHRASVRDVVAGRGDAGCCRLPDELLRWRITVTRCWCARVPRLGTFKLMASSESIWTIGSMLVWCRGRLGYGHGPSRSHTSIRPLRSPAAKCCIAHYNIFVESKVAWLELYTWSLHYVKSYVKSYDFTWIHTWFDVISSERAQPLVGSF